MWQVSYTEEQNLWLKENYRKYVGCGLAQAFYDKFKVMKRARTLELHCRRELHLKKDSNGQFEKKYTEEMIKWITDNFDDYSISELTKEFNKTFNMQISSLASKVIALHLIRKDKRTKMLKCANKIRKTLEDKYPIGSEKVSEADFIYVKVCNGKSSKNWRLKHYIVYEKYFGKIPDNHYVIFLDGNKRNFDINNLKCIDRPTLMSYYNYKTDDAIFNNKVIEYIQLEKEIKKLMS